MSKPCSGHFYGTIGYRNAEKNKAQNSANRAIIASKDIDTREHPTKYKQMSSKKLKELREKKKNHTITKEEYKRLNWQTRLTKRRNEAVKDFWEKEVYLIRNNLPTTRNWSAQQMQEILSGQKPKYNGRTMSSHHMYSVAKYPHLANRMELIFPATQYEHIYGWHGGNTRNSLPGKPIKIIQEF